MEKNKNKKLKVLSIGSEGKVLDSESRPAQRIAEYGKMTDKYWVIVPGGKGEKIDLSDKVSVFGVGAGNKFLQLLKIYFLASAILKKEKFSLITVQDQYYLAFISWFLSRKYRIGLEVQNHGFEKLHGLRKIIAKFILKRAKAVRTVSSRLKRRLINEFKVPEDRINIIPMYISLPEHKNEPSKDESKLIFLTIGRLVPVKNLEIQISAMSVLIGKYADIELWIVGEGPLERKLKKMINESGVGACVKFFGWSDHIEDFYRKADVFLLTSESEGWPSVIVEAASMSLPIIMTDVGSAGELIINKKSGIIIRKSSKEDLVNAMEEMISDKNLRKRLGEEARRAAASLPDFEETLELYRRSWEKAAGLFEKKF